MWPLVLAAADVPGGCCFSLAVFESFVGAMDNERGVLIVSAHLQDSCVSSCFISANFGGLRPQQSCWGGMHGVHPEQWESPGCFCSLLLGCVNAETYLGSCSLSSCLCWIMRAKAGFLILDSKSEIIQVHR